MVKKREPGRPRGDTNARAAILDAARRRFNAVGYQRATLRSIAADAGVDAAMISYYFGSKHALLGEVVELRADPASILTERLDVPIEQMPRAVLTALFAAWEAPGSQPTLLVRVADDPAFRRMLKEFIETELIGPLSRRIEREGFDKAEAQRRAVSFATQIIGIVFARYVVGVGPIADSSPHDLVGQIAPVLSALLRVDTRRD